MIEDTCLPFHSATVSDILKYDDHGPNFPNLALSTGDCPIYKKM